MTKEKDPNKICPPILTTNSCDYEVSTPINSVQYYKGYMFLQQGAKKEMLLLQYSRHHVRVKKKKQGRQEGRKEEGMRKKKEGREGATVVVRIQIFLHSSTSASPMEMLPAYICTLLKNTIILYNNKVRHANSPTESCITLLLMNDVVQKKVSIPRGKNLEFYIRLFWMIISYKRELTPKIC